MSYLALARKWRPRRFEDVVGQPHVVQALTHALDTDRLHPAILLTGTRGVGKTTLARIVAKSLNCEIGVSANPCGECSSCREVDEGRFVDLLEIDAASRTKVEDTRSMLDNVQYAPVRGRYKVYLIDEVHMLSGHSFNALLKTLEEPPPHVKFILATTDPQKLPITVLSRCLQFHLKRFPTGSIRSLMERVLAEEGVTFESPALAELARAADGSMRDGLSLLDQALVFAGGSSLSVAQIDDMLGSGGRRLLLELIGAVAAADSDRLLAGFQRLDEMAPDFSALSDDLSAILQRIAVLQLLPKARNEDDDDALVELAQSLPAEDVQLYYQIAITGRRDLPWTPDPRLGFEMTVLRMMTFRPVDVPPAPVGAGAGASGGRSEGSGSSPRSNAASAAGASAARNDAAPPARPPVQLVRPEPAAAQATAAPSANNDAGDAFSPEDERWADQVETLELEGFVRGLARHCAWIAQDDNRVRLGLLGSFEHLLQDERRQLIQDALSKAQGRPLMLAIEMNETATRTPMERDRRRAAARQAAAEAAIAQDPNVRALQDRFGAQLRTGSVQPL